MSTKAIFDNIAEHLEEQIDLAENKIVVAVAWFTNKRLFDALCIKAADGVEVKLIISDNEINRNSNIDYGDIQIGKSKLYLIDEEKMHHKFCIIDDYIVITGSYNWSYRAESNFENILISIDNIDLVKQYKNEVRKIIKDYLPENVINPKSRWEEAIKSGRIKPYIPPLRIRANDTPTLKPSTKIYFESVKIGKQEWMLKNLDVAKFKNGDVIPHAISDEDWEIAGIYNQPAWCYYQNDPNNGKKYGKLYNWYAVNDPRGLAPNGWHIASDDEWSILTEYLGGKDFAGFEMKSNKGWEDWENPDTDETGKGNGNNSTGLNILPGGGRWSNGTFSPSVRAYSIFWSTTEYNYEYVFYRELYNFSNGLGRHHYYSDKSCGSSVRCIKDSGDSKLVQAVSPSTIKPYRPPGLKLK
jgi:uncharacterized protein (TIGR02145 family)